ncbi:TIR domain-containing protein [Actinoplanes sp. CA-030573]|uniref:toll/interleukin-1 receptor domain-containing protein n=1 Tax=Actinoplanes sp. CA-030573 TaxID=3239898 RepID=UPI003D9509A8
MLEELRRSLESAPDSPVLPQALHGFGGVGKTQLAVEYAYRYADDYDVVWWIPAEDPSLVERSLGDLGRRLGIPIHGDPDDAVAALESTGLSWLLVFDNADDPDDLAHLVPAGGHVLITSRNPKWSDAVHGFEVDDFDRRERVPDTIASLVPGPRPPEIYVSYKWGGASEAVVDHLVATLAKQGLPVRRDKHEIPYRGSIQEFMRRVGNAELLIVVLDDAYLRSTNCMFELTEIAGRENFAKRLFPIVLPDADIFRARGRVRYVKHWEAQRAELEAEMREVALEHLGPLQQDLDLVAKICGTVARITDVLRDMNTLTEAQHSNGDFAELIRAIREQHARR